MMVGSFPAQLCVCGTPNTELPKAGRTRGAHTRQQKAKSVLFN